LPAACAVFHNEINKGEKMNDERKLSKTKVSAVILTILFGLFGWLYTYKKNKVKFWVALAIVIFLLIIYLATAELVIGALILPFFYVVSFGLWLWALLDNALKPNSFFENYPN
jgi:hypothetical protein